MEDQLEQKIGNNIGQKLAERFNFRGDPTLIASDRDYWSVILIYEIPTEHSGNGTNKIYCKIPKTNWHISTVNAILTKDFESSKEMAETEFGSLQYLHTEFEHCPDHSLRVVNPLGYLPEYNAIVTEGIDNGMEIFELLRPWGNRKSVDNNVLLPLRKIGKWLGYLHNNCSIISLNGFKTQAPFPNQMQQLTNCATAFTDRALVTRLVVYIERLLKNGWEDLSSRTSFVIEGFEVRNFITDGEAIFFLDPGYIRSGPVYEDLARFIASLSILYWGKISFLRDYRNEENFISLFLESYENECGGIERDILEIYLAKQYIKLWIDGIKVLQFKNFRKPFDKIIQQLYVERFFSSRLDKVLSTLRSN